MMNDALAEKQPNNVSLTTIVISIILCLLAVLAISIISQGMSDPIPVPVSQGGQITRSKPTEAVREIPRAVPLNCDEGPSYGRDGLGVCTKPSSCEAARVKTCGEALQLVRNSLGCAEQRLSWQESCVPLTADTATHMEQIRLRLNSAQKCFEYINWKRLCSEQQDAVNALKAEKNALRLRLKAL